MFKDYKLKDIFHLTLGSLLVIGIIMAYITIGGWGEFNSSQSPKPIHSQKQRTVTEDVLKEDIEEFVYKPCPTCTVIDKDNVKQLSKTESNYQTFEVTAYTSNYESTGKTPSHPEYGITASGKRVRENHTIACPPNMEFGTKIYIPYFDNTFTCQDRGSAIVSGHLDVYMKDVDDAMKFGRRKLEIKFIK